MTTLLSLVGIFVATSCATAAGMMGLVVLSARLRTCSIREALSAHHFLDERERAMWVFGSLFAVFFGISVGLSLYWALLG